MKLAEMKDYFKDFWNEFKKEKTGVFGLILFAVFLSIIIFEPVLLPNADANTRWRDITYWEDHPKSAPPVWTDWFRVNKESRTEELSDYSITEKDLGAMKMIDYNFDYEMVYDSAPNDIIIHANSSGNPMIVVKVLRPDGMEIELYQNQYNIGKSKKNIRISIDNNAREKMYHYASKIETPENLKAIKPSMTKTTNVIFSEAQAGILRYPKVLKGDYRIQLTAILQGEDDLFDDPTLVLPGKVSGVLGTDSQKRDIWTGVLAGVKWALLIGILTAVVSVSIGVIYGVISAYLGGWKDALMQRVFEVFVSVPLLPVLIVLSAVFEPSIWTVVIIMSMFFWTGSVKTVRSMAMQIKEETFIEASKALGASNFRIIFKHMVPILIPYSFSSMALFIPRAVVYEASISLLGL